MTPCSSTSPRWVNCMGHFTKVNCMAHFAKVSCLGHFTKVSCMGHFTKVSCLAQFTKLSCMAHFTKVSYMAHLIEVVFMSPTSLKIIACSTSLRSVACLHHNAQSHAWLHCFLLLRPQKLLCLLYSPLDSLWWWGEDLNPEVQKVWYVVQALLLQSLDT